MSADVQAAVYALIGKQRNWSTSRGKPFEIWLAPEGGVRTLPGTGNQKQYGGSREHVTKVLGYFESARLVGAQLRVGHGRKSGLASYLFPLYLEACRRHDWPVRVHGA